MCTKIVRNRTKSSVCVLLGIFFEKSTIRALFVHNLYGFCTIIIICVSVFCVIDFARPYKCTIFFPFFKVVYF